MFSRNRTNRSTADYSVEIEKCKVALAEADAILVGAGAGLSTSAGFTYSGERFEWYFSDFAERYHFRDMYSGGFYPYDTLEEYWGFWSRYIFVNRYQNPPKNVYETLFQLVEGKDYFVLTTNVDHCFQKAGFDKHKLFYTQGDYGLWQCSKPCHDATYDNEETVRKMVEAQGYTIGTDNALMESKDGALNRTVPSELVPHCPRCGAPMTMNLRADDSFVQDDGWYVAQNRYADFLRRHQSGKILFLELGVGGNTPGIVKYPFWKFTEKNPDAVYACINYGEAYAPSVIEKQSICIDGDIGEVLTKLL